jgi:hypothetical protein
VIPDVFNRTLGQRAYERGNHRKQGNPENHFQNDRGRGEETHGFLQDAAQCIRASISRDKSTTIS